MSVIHVVSARPLSEYRLDVTFNDGVRGVFSVEPQKRGGVFLNDDSIQTPPPWQARFEALRYRYIQEREQALRAITRSIEEIMAERKEHAQRHQNYKAPLRDQLDWLTEAGFESVDCFWKYLDNAIFGGVKAG